MLCAFYITKTACRAEGGFMGKYEILLWDVDQTLLDFEKSQEYALYHCFKQFGKSADQSILSLYAKINDFFWKRYELGEVTKAELLVGRFTALFSKLGIEDLSPKDFQLAYQKALGSVFYFRDNGDELCKKLKGVVRQYAVTNGVSSTQRNKLHLSGLDQIFEDIFISEEIGYPKPQIQYFEACFQKIPDFKKDKTLIIGDSLSSDMQGGNTAGIACCWYNPEGKENTTDLRIDYEIKNLWEVEELLSWQKAPTRN